MNCKEVAGIYKRTTKMSLNNVYDLRFKDANGNEYLNPAVIQALDILLSTKLYEDFTHELVAISALSDQTGLKVITNHAPMYDLVHRLERVHMDIDAVEELEIPDTCGQDTLIDLDGAKEAYKKFYKTVVEPLTNDPKALMAD